MIERLCRSCGKSFEQWNSMNTKCPLCLMNKYNFKQKKPMKRIGKIGKQWIADRKLWIKNNPANSSGFWYCFYCGKLLTIDNLTLDHKLSRGRHPDKRRSQDNLAPACYNCNKEKGSKDYDKM